jgi:hypothetical protein
VVTRRIYRRTRWTPCHGALLHPQTGPSRPRHFIAASGSGNFLPTYHKLDFPKFDGSISVCAGRRSRRVSYTSFHLLDDAQPWFHRLELNGAIPTWQRFVQLINPLWSASALRTLALLRRDGSVEEFCNRFMSLSCRDHSCTKHQQVQLFTTGHEEPLHTNVALQQPATLDEVIMLARAYEQHTLLPATPTTAASKSASCSVTKLWPAVSSAPIASGTSSAASSLTSKPALTKKFSATEIADRRAKGLCFKSDEKFAPGHVSHAQ